MWTSCSSKYACQGHTAQTLAKHWEERLASGVDRSQEAELVVREAYSLILANCTQMKPALWSESHVEHTLREVRKYKDTSTPPRKTVAVSGGR